MQLLAGGDSLHVPGYNLILHFIPINECTTHQQSNVSVWISGVAWILWCYLDHVWHRRRGQEKALQATNQRVLFLKTSHHQHHQHQSKTQVIEIIPSIMTRPKPSKRSIAASSRSYSHSWQFIFSLLAITSHEWPGPHETNTTITQTRSRKRPQPTPSSARPSKSASPNEQPLPSQTSLNYKHHNI